MPVPMNIITNRSKSKTSLSTRLKAIRWVFGVLLVLLAIGSLFSSIPNAGVPTEKAVDVSPTSQISLDTAKVTKVVDGDTIEVLVKGKIEMIRLIGVDTPETVDPRKPVQCFGKEASAHTKAQLLGKNVGLEADSTQGERDKYKRLLRYVFLENGVNFNKQLIHEGYAYEYTYDLAYKYQAEFKQAQIDAQKNKRGFWADNACPAQPITTPIID